MKHANAEMIRAVIDNTELVIFCEVVGHENEGGNYWAVSNLSSLVSCFNKFFVCLPQHKEACLHWLNGGDVQSLSDYKWFDVLDWSYFWSVNSGFMQDDFTTRIKPQKEKRWIVYRNGTVYGDFLSPEDINDDFKNTGQVIEIEVEV